MTALVLLVLGLGAGVLSGMLGIGGGSVLVPVLVALGYKAHVSIGTSLAVIIPVTLVGTLVYHAHGNVDFEVFAMVVSGAIVGALVGAELAQSIPSAVLVRVFGVALTLIGLKMALFG